MSEAWTDHKTQTHTQTTVSVLLESQVVAPPPQLRAPDPAEAVAVTVRFCSVSHVNLRSGVALKPARVSIISCNLSYFISVQRETKRQPREPPRVLAHAVFPLLRGLSGPSFGFSLSVKLPAVDPGCRASLVSGEHHLREPDEGVPLR